MRYQEGSGHRCHIATLYSSPFSSLLLAPLPAAPRAASEGVAARRASRVSSISFHRVPPMRLACRCTHISMEHRLAHCIPGTHAPSYPRPCTHPHPSPRTWSSLGSLVSGFWHRSIVCAVGRLALPHHVSHQSHSSGNEWMGTCARADTCEVRAMVQPGAACGEAERDYRRLVWSRAAAAPDAASSLASPGRGWRERTGRR